MPFSGRRNPLPRQRLEEAISLPSTGPPGARSRKAKLHFSPGTTVKTFTYGCRESKDCLAPKQSWTEVLLAHGAEQVLWLGPQASRLQVK
jgi:hypothetical protein